MKPQQRRMDFNQSGMVLVSGLLLLLVVTIMALSVFRSFGVQERIAGNIREKTRAVQAAMSTQQFAEWWLATQSNAPRAISEGLAADAAIPCANGLILDANTGQGQICLNSLLSIGPMSSLVSWPTAVIAGNSTTGVQYTPTNYNYVTTGGAQVTNSAITTDYYYTRPRFYIADVGPLPTGRGEVYQVDAYSFGESASSLAVVESTVAITCQVCNVGGL